MNIRQPNIPHQISTVLWSEYSLAAAQDSADTRALVERAYRWKPNRFPRQPQPPGCRLNTVGTDRRRTRNSNLEYL